MDWVRELVSGDRRRLKTADGFNLDMSYVTPQLIAMSYPAHGVEGSYRNHIDKVSAFLDERYRTGTHTRYMVYNLSGRRYDYEKFHHQVMDFPFPDHFPPGLQQLFKLCRTMHAWLEADPFHVAVVHCMAGKGRTGTVLAAYMLYAGIHGTAREALDAFATARNTGVTMPSQRRYVEYFAQALSQWRAHGALAESPPMLLRKIILHPPPAFGVLSNAGPVGASFSAVSAPGASHGCRPVLQVLRAPSDQAAVDPEGSILFSSAWSDADVAAFGAGHADEGGSIVFAVERPVAGDILVRCYHLHESSVAAGRELMFRVSFNLQYERASADPTAATVVRLPLAQLDGADKRRMPSDFAVDLCLAPLPAGAAAAADIGSIPLTMNDEQLLANTPDARALIDAGVPREEVLAGLRAAPASGGAAAGPSSEAPAALGGEQQAPLSWPSGASELASLAPLRREAWLWKRGEINTQFKRRWCCLRQMRTADHPAEGGVGGGVGGGFGGATAARCASSYQYALSYFGSPDEITPRGSIPLASVLRIETIGAQDGRRHCFALHTPLRVYVFCPGSGDGDADAEATRAWVQLLVHAKARQLMEAADAESTPSALGLYTGL